MRFLGFETPVWAIQVVECAERCAYYAVAFSLYTYLMNMLRMSMAASNAAINGVYIVIPLAACVASGIADGTTGQPRVLYVSICLYAVGLLLVTLSSLPLFYSDFPSHPSAMSYVFFTAGIVLFSIGYGSMKVCTNPIMANSVRDGVRAMTAASAEAISFTCEDARADDVASPHLVSPTTLHKSTAEAFADATEPTKPQSSATPHDVTEAALEVLLPRLFRVTYWVTNFGALLGIFAAPLLRNLDSRTGQDGDTVFTTGYYWSFAFGFLSILVGLCLYHRNQYRYPQNEPSPTFVLFRVAGRAAWIRLAFASGRIKDEPFQQRARDWLDYSGYQAQGVDQVEALAPQAREGYDTAESYAAPRSASHGLDDGAYDLNTVTSSGWIADCRVTLAVCKAFVALPIYWLICNQFSTNLMYQASALNLPLWVPPEMFNNINVFSLLLFLVVFDKLLVPRVFGGRTPPAVYRIIAGFALMVVTMVWCGVVQVGVTKRGTYSSSEAYVLHPGQSKMSAGWLVVPYILQGIASALVDPSVMEVAYTDAPERMKGQVMGLYWVASSVSGFLGILLSPVMKPQNTVALFFSFAVALAASTVLFYCLNARNRASTGG